MFQFTSDFHWKYPKSTKVETPQFPLEVAWNVLWFDNMFCNSEMEGNDEIKEFWWSST